MQIAVRFTTCVALAFLGAPLAFAQGQLWIVDEAGGPGVDFTEIQPAVDAAADGDTVLVRSPGFYGEFTINAKSLVVTGDELGQATVLQFRVQGLAPDQEVAVRGLTVILGGQLQQNAGPVWLEELTMFVPPPCVLSFLFGLYVDGCSAVVATRCVFAAGLGSSGILASDSTLHLFETTAVGGKSGGSGVKVENSFLFASGCTFQGGCGSDGGECIPGSKGGYGLWRTGGPAPQLLQTTLIGGLGGCAFDCAGLCGPVGDEAFGGYELVAGYARDYVLASPAAGGQTTTIDYAGYPGDFVFSLIGLAQSPLYLPALAGTLMLPIPPLLFSHGPADVSGALQVVVTLPPLPPGFEAFTIYAQAAAVSSVGAAVLGAPSQLSIL